MSSEIKKPEWLKEMLRYNRLLDNYKPKDDFLKIKKGIVEKSSLVGNHAKMQNRLELFKLSNNGFEFIFDTKDLKIKKVLK